MRLTKQFAEKLSLALHRRRIRHGIVMLDSVETELQRIGPDTPNSARLLLLLAQWIDLGYRDYRFLDPLLAQFQSADRKKLNLEDYLQLRMAEAFRGLASGECDACIEALDFVLKSLNDIGEGPQLALAQGMLGNKTFQQISGEIAEIVIPKAWMREGRKIARVAARLSISPKKVRRILRNSGSIRRG
jgi:hypothetical protein